MAERRLLIACAILALLAAGCRQREPARAPAIGEAYVAPETLNLRNDIPMGSGTVAMVKRGDRVEILQRRRRFVKVRTAAKQEGWTEQGQLLTPETYQQIEQMARQAANLASYGVYRARDKLNIHFEPYRWSPSFYQLKEEEKADVLERRITDRTQAPPAESKPPLTGAGEPEKPRARDEWYLVRTADPAARVDGVQRAGWVLARMMDADIPDEVAQYAEGRRITSYFPLAETIDGDQVKKTWLWTTVERGNEAYDFDGFRVFNWGRRRHRYETAYHERNLNGFFPVTTSPQVETRYGKGPGFSILIEKADGRRYIRRYVMLSPVVRRYAEEPAPAPAAAMPAPEPAAPLKPAESTSWMRRLWNKLRGR